MTLNVLIDKVLTDSRNHWTDDESIDQLEEEMAELIVALKHYKRGRVTMSEVMAEIGDVTIMLESISGREIFGTKTDFYDAIETKLKKMEHLIEINSK